MPNVGSRSIEEGIAAMANLSLDDKPEPKNKPKKNKKNKKNETKRDKPEENLGKPEKKGLTPYQGERRTFGKFKCTKCAAVWASAYSWADYGQECKNCEINIYPYVQFPIKRSGSDTKKPHLDDLCEKCQHLGRSCTESRTSKRRTSKRRTSKRRTSKRRI